MLIGSIVDVGYLAYKGKRYSIEWYFNIRGKSQAFDCFQELSMDRQKKIFYLFQLMGDFGLIKNIEKFRHEGEQIYVFKADIDRFFCFFFSGMRVVITNAYEKKRDRLPQEEKRKALEARMDYIERFNRGNYYE